MKNVKIPVVIFLISFTLIISCAPLQRMASTKPEPRWDTPYASYPRYRIHPPARKISILGSGEGKHDISGGLTKGIINYTSQPIKVIEPGNIEAVLKGRIIEYGTGLNRDEAQVISQMLQVDHIILFDAKTSPHQDYMYGGRFEARINLKMINTISGEIVFQTSKTLGANYPDPRPTYTHWNPLPSSIIRKVRDACLFMTLFELRYALGEVSTGLLYSSFAPLIVGKLMINSPVDKVGIKEGDKVIEIEGIKISNYSDYENFWHTPAKQGESIKMKIEREGEILEKALNFPVIPSPPLQEIDKKIDKEKKPVGPKI